MKKIFNKSVVIVLLAFSFIASTVFGGIILSNTANQSVYAIDEEPSEPNIPTPTPDEEDPEAPDNDSETPNPENPDEEENEDGEESDDSAEDEESATESTTTICAEKTGSLSWIVCPTTELISNVVDELYNKIDDLLIVQPLTTDSTSPIYIVWQYMRSITNIVFVIFLLIVIFSQVTGLGINNYGVKRVLPRLIIAVILVNLSFLICSLAVDLSNIIGASLRNFFLGVQENMLAASGEFSAVSDVSIASIISVVVGGGTVAGVAIGFFGGGIGGVFYALLIALIGAAAAVISGLITIAARQALVALLIMVAPLAFVAYLLPNTEKWFTQWKNLLTRMLVFYPMFSFLFGASQLAGWALIAAAKDGFGVVLGLAVQVFPLFFSWSLMKMSGTVLGAINSGVRKAIAPAQRSAGGWALEKREQARQNYYANSAMPGARLREFLDNRRDLRLMDTKNALEIRRNRSLQKVYTKASGIQGRDAEGNLTWDETANKYVRNAKTAAYYSTTASTAQLAHQNTLSGYGRYFSDPYSQYISDAHGEAFADSMAQQFLATNEAQADQEWLLNRYLNAKKNLHKDSYEYNRLIRSAAGGLGHNGESSIMGQVIIGNSNIENRRRTEGRIMINKFGMEKHKQELRGMIFDVNKINDNGFATDEHGTPIEDDQYNLLPGKQYTPWQRYIGVNKITGQEITKAEYDALSDSERANWTKIRYFDITDDHDNEVQRIFEDDAGYMKEILSDDVYISDPIVRRFTTQIGVAKQPGEKDGMLRRYHSTIRAAVDSSGFSKGHGAAYTQMYTSAANAGLIKNMCDHNVILLQSFAASSKPGNFAQQDAFFIEELDKLFCLAVQPEKFSHYFPDEYLNGSTNNNGVPLDGMRLVTTKDKDGNMVPKWEEVNHHELETLDEETALEYRKNFVKHKMIPKGIGVAVGALERKMSPETINSLKPGAKEKLDIMREHLSAIGVMNLDDSIEFTERPDGNKNLFQVPDTESLRQGVKATQQYIDEKYHTQSSARPSKDSVRHSSNATINLFTEKLARSAEADARIERYNDMMDIMGEFEGYYISATSNGLGLEVFCADVISLFEERPRLRNYLEECQQIVTTYYNMPRPNRDNFISQITNHDEFEREQIDNIYNEVKDLIYRAGNDV